jgi:redox-sensitive bicupin YhaK (pirin superfamily)
MTYLIPRIHDLGGGFLVRRVLPSMHRPSLGPFVFFDHFGPVTAHPGDNHDVRPHPHIGLATVTYLLEGAMMHRDSTGSVQRIEPGAVNWMTAGSGIVHSERTPDDVRDTVRTSHGFQLWAALPEAHEEDAPSFAHTSAQAIPVVDLPGVKIRVLVGAAFGAASPVATLSPTLYVAMEMDAGASVALPAAALERGVYNVDAEVSVGSKSLPAGQMLVLQEGDEPMVRAATPTRLMLLGGSPLGHRFMVWNFVSSRKARILQAQDDWEAQRFATVPGETEFIPLPPRRG